MPLLMSSGGEQAIDRGKNGVEAGMSPWRPDFMETKCGEEEPAGVETGDMLISTIKDFDAFSLLGAPPLAAFYKFCRPEANQLFPLVNISMPCAQHTVKKSLTGPLFSGYLPT